MSQFRNNYIRPEKDDRDYKFGASNVNASELSKHSNQTKFTMKVNRIEQQGELGNCTGVACTTAFEHLIYLLCHDETFQASALYNYTQSRILDSVDLKSDPGTSLRSASSNLRLTGAPRDTSWPYSLSLFSVVPSDQVYQEAFLLSKMITYFEVNRSRDIMKYILGDLNFMILIGFSVYPSFQTQQVAESGDIPYPSSQEIQTGSTSGHATVIVGWDDDKQAYIIANSYGTNWGQNGYGSIPYIYVEDENLVSEVKLLYPTDNFVTIYDNFERFCANQSSSSYASSHAQTSFFTVSRLALLFSFVMIILFIISIVQTYNRR